MKTIIIKSKSIILLFLIFPVIAFSQTKKEIAYEQVKQLKNGVLLVQLESGAKQVEALRKSDRHRAAEKKMRKIKETNREIIESFKHNFTFCPVYFYVPESAKAIKGGDFKGHLLNTDFEAVEADNLNINTYFIADFGETEEMKIDALVMYDQNGTQLDSPFPYYIKSYYFFPLLGRKKIDMVGLLDDKLHDLLEKAES